MDRLQNIDLTRTIRWAGLIAGPIAAIVVYLALPTVYPSPAGEMVELTHAARATAAVASWMAIWWLTEAIPVSATALLPVALFPTVGAIDVTAAARPYGHPLIFLFIGGFLISLSMERWGLHRRAALRVLRSVGTRPSRVVGGFMFVSAVMSMWVTNTATTLMMLPIALSVVGVMSADPDDSFVEQPAPGETSAFALCLLLGIAYAASIGGIGTIIGTVPNGVLVAYVAENLGRRISFVEWMKVGIPVVVVLLPTTWYVLTRFVFPLKDEESSAGAELIDAEYQQLGAMNAGEWATLAVFLSAAALWITRPLLQNIEVAGMAPFARLTDASISVIAGVALFVIPVDRTTQTFTMDWAQARKLPFGILLLIGGGLSLASAIDSTGVGAYLGASFVGLKGLPVVLVLLAVIGAIVFLTELTSNTATTATMIPILAALAPALDIEPLMMIVPATIGASCAFMLPVATPPNAIVFGSNRITIGEMARAGFWLNVGGIVLITLFGYLLALPLLGV